MQVTVMEDDRKKALQANTDYSTSLKINYDDFSREFYGQRLLFELTKHTPRLMTPNTVHSDNTEPAK